MMRLLLILLIFIATPLFAQKDMVRAKDGSVLRGTIIRNSVEEHLTIQIVDSVEVKLYYDHIIAIRSKGFRYRSSYPVNTRGYYNNTTLGLILQKSNSGDPVVGEPALHTINGFIFNRFAKIGLGVGYDGYPDIHTVPVYLNVQGDILSSKVTPVYGFGIGYGIASARNQEFGQISDARGGIFFQPSIGVMFNGIVSSFVVALDYKHQVATLDYNDWWFGGDLSEKRTFRNLAIKIGFLF